MKNLAFVLFFIVNNLWSQTNGIVKDSISGRPIAYVSIWVENENIGTTSEENGSFSIETNDPNKTLKFSALGFKTKYVKVKNAQSVLLLEDYLEIEEIAITNKKSTKKIEIGNIKNVISEAFDNGPKMDAKFFPYFPKYQSTRWIDAVTIFTDSRVEEGIIKLHIFEVDENGFPGKELLTKDKIITLKRGVYKHTVDLTSLNLLMPKKGVFVAFEKLFVEKNRIERTTLDPHSKIERKKIVYFPFVLYNIIEKDYVYSYSGGKWHKLTPQQINPYSSNGRVYEPSISLILGN